METVNIFLAMPENEITASFLDEANLAYLNSLGRVCRQSKPSPLTEDELAEALVDQDVIVSGWGQAYFSDKVLDRARRLRFIAHTAGSVASFCGREVYDRGIRVTSGNDIFGASVAEAVLAYALASLRDIPRYDRAMKEGAWRDDVDNRGLFGRTVGLLGFGTIARQLVPMLKPFSCPVIAYDPLVSREEMESYGVEKVDFEAIFTDSDIVSVHLPLKDDTVGLVDERSLHSMKKGALLINTARGAVIDEAALAAVLGEGLISAVLDVFAVEPLPADSPLRKTPNTILIPHMAGPTLDRRVDAARIVIEDIERFIKGEELKHEIKAEKAGQMSRG